ncbi:FimD/PapC N-terminal domain-containing protein [Escherichia coli]|nr:FimD/PapC N-terminal domain-containing protein [Escherichia coli]
MKGSLKKSLLLLRITIICPVFSCAAVSPSPDNSHRFSFNPDFLQLSDGDNAKNIDLNYFANASGAAPGEYTVDVVMNGELVDRQIKIDFFRAGQQAERQTDASTVGTLGN